VRRLRNILTVLLAILWLPVTSHCLLFETADGFDLLSCCTHAETPGNTDHHENECATDSCAIVESGQYKTSLQRLTIPPFVTQVAFELPAPFTATLPPILIPLQHIDGDLASRPGTWQFSARTALPPRAPSCVS